MSQKEMSQIICKINNLSSSIKGILETRKHKNWAGNQLSIFVEEIICSMKISSTDNGFILNYTCIQDHSIVCFPENINRMKHCLFEILCILELHDLKASMPVHHKLQELRQELKNLFLLISTDENVYNM